MATRKVTNKLVEMMEEGSLDPLEVAKACMMFMGERKVAVMAEENEFLIDDAYENEDDDLDGEVEEVSFDDEELY